jgi:SAM-dependent methyltransferase
MVRAIVAAMTTVSKTVRNPLFARYFNRFAARREERGNRELRQELLSGLSGRVIEVGAGNGLNFPHYPQAVREVVAVEPEPYLRVRAAETTPAAPVPVRVTDGTAGDLPAADGEFDAVVVSGLLCSVPMSRQRWPNSAGSCGPAASCASMSTYAAGTRSSPGTNGSPTLSGRA